MTSSVANKAELSREFRGIRFSRGKFLNLAQEEPQNVEKKTQFFGSYLSIFYLDNFSHVNLKLASDFYFTQREKGRAQQRVLSQT